MASRLPKRCSLRQVDLGGKNEFMYEVVCGGERVGAIMAARKKFAGKVRYAVFGVNVLEKARRQGIATRLYEAAAAEACRRRAPLASFERVGGGRSRAFWDKQMRKGRAKVLSKRGGYEDGKRSEVFELTCPAPADLSGKRRRR